MNRMPLMLSLVINARIHCGFLQLCRETVPSKENCDMSGRDNCDNRNVQTIYAAMLQIHIPVDSKNILNSPDSSHHDRQL